MVVAPCGLGNVEVYLSNTDTSFPNIFTPPLVECLDADILHLYFILPFSLICMRES